jgi:hypothetical protein
MIDYRDWIEQNKTFDVCNGCNRKTGRVFKPGGRKSDYGLCEECWDKRVDYIKRYCK